MHARDALTRSADARVERRGTAHFVTLLAHDPLAVTQPMTHEIRRERTGGRAGRGIFGDTLPGRVHAAVRGRALLGGLGREDVGGFAKRAWRRHTHCGDALDRHEHEAIPTRADLDRQRHDDVGLVEHELPEHRRAIVDWLEYREWLLHLGEAIAHRHRERAN